MTDGPDSERALPALTAADAAELLERSGVASELTVVGGQALNAWAELYRDDDPDLAALAPFATPDLDVLGRERHAHEMSRRLGGRLDKPDLDQVNMPEIAVVRVERGGHTVRIDFMGSIIGATTSQVAATAVTVQLSETFAVRVMHPVLLLETRLQNTVGVLARQDPTSLRRLLAAALICRDHIARAAGVDPRAALNMIERVADIFSSDNATRVWLDHGIDLSIPLQPYAGLPAEFEAIRLPQLQSHLTREREHLRALRSQRESGGRRQS